MKKSALLFILLLNFFFASAQGNYHDVMISNIKALDTAKDVGSLNKITSVFTAIYAFKKDWHPLYYECLGYLKLSKAYSSIDQRKGAIQKASSLLENLPVEDDEVQVLKGLYAMNYLSIDRSEWQTYLPMLQTALSKAQEINPNNPRTYYLQGIIKYNMPESMGGGKDEGIKLFKKALLKYDTFSSKDEYVPTWGKNEMIPLLSN